MTPAVAKAMCRFWMAYILATNQTRFNRKKELWKYYFQNNDVAGNKEGSD